MAAILEPRLIPAPHRPVRPPLRAVASGGGVRTPRSGASGPPSASAPLGHAATVDASHVVTIAVAAVLALLVIVGAVAIGRGALAGLAPAGPSGVPGAASGPTTTVQVEAGDTMWTIARDLRPHGEVRPLVDELVALNGSATIHPGQELVVPAG